MKLGGGRGDKNFPHVFAATLTGQTGFPIAAGRREGFPGISGAFAQDLRATMAWARSIQRIKGAEGEGNNLSAFPRFRNRLEAARILVPGLPADPKIPAQLGHRETTRQGRRYKSFFFVHQFDFFPRHSSQIEVLPMSSDRTNYA